MTMTSVAMQDAQKTMMSVQEEIKRRLTALETTVKALAPPTCGNLDGMGGQPIQYQPPPAPLPAAPTTPTTPVARFAPVPQTTPLATSTPSAPITPNNACLSDTPEPFPYKPVHCTFAVPSSEINKAKLLPIGDALAKHSNLIYSSKVRSLASKLAKESVFGDDVLIRCTVAGSRSFPALPVAELNYLKTIVFKQFPVYWNAKHEFEAVWKDCIDGIGQACKRLRHAK